MRGNRLLSISDRQEDLIDAYDSLWMLSCNEDASAVDIRNIVKYLNDELKSIHEEFELVRKGKPPGIKLVE